MKVSILTTTFYRSVEETRFHLACQLVGNAVAVGYGVIVVDGSPDQSIRKAFKRISADVHQQKKQGMGPSRRELFGFASDSDAEIFVWTEEKSDLIRLIPQIIAPIKSGEAKIVIPSRTERSWQSYPSFQITSEQEANVVYAEVTGKHFDPMFGPVAFHSSVVNYFANCNPAEQFGATDGYIQHFAPLQAMVEGREIASVPVEFFYPSAQKAEEESNLREDMLVKRKGQLDQLVNGYRLAAKALCLPARV